MLQFANLIRKSVLQAIIQTVLTEHMKREEAGIGGREQLHIGMSLGNFSQATVSLLNSLLAAIAYDMNS